jgi:hypothetical protein
VILEHLVLGLHTCLVPVFLSFPLLSCIPCLGSALQYTPLHLLSAFAYLVCITSTSILASLHCTCFVIARQILNSLSTFRANPTTVHVGQYGQPTVTPEDIQRLNKDLKRITWRAKIKWANNFITAANIWEVAAWRHGRHSSHIAVLRLADESLSFDHEEMLDTLSRRFFTEDRGNIPESFPDDPPPCEARPFPPFNEDELFALLKAATNKSAPGGLGIGWDLMKKGWSHMSELLTNIYNACITTGHHPARWKEAMVVVIPKADKPDYSAAKAYWPISLLENLSKLLEKVVAKRFQHDIVTHELIPTNQFGGQTHSSCLDAGLTLIHDIQTAHANGLKVGILLFNVQGFFDNVNHARLVALIKNMGFSSNLAQWMASFLANQKVRLRFNNITSD